MFCPLCGLKVPQGAAFCSYCGGKILRKGTVPQSAVKAQAIKPPSIEPPAPAEKVPSHPSGGISYPGITAQKQTPKTLETEGFVSSLEKERSQFAAERGVLLDQIANLQKVKEAQFQENLRLKQELEGAKTQKANEQARIDQDKAALKRATDELAIFRENLLKEQEQYKALIVSEQGKLENQRKRLEAERQDFLQDRVKIRADFESERVKMRGESEEKLKSLDDTRRELDGQRKKLAEETQTSLEALLKEKAEIDQLRKALAEDTQFVQKELAKEKKDIETFKRASRSGKINPLVAVSWAVAGLICGIGVGFGVVRFALPKSPGVPVGLISLGSHPSEAMVTLEGTPSALGQTPLRNIAVPAGAYTLKMDRQGYETRSQRIYIEQGKETSIDTFTLTALSKPKNSLAKDSTSVGALDSFGTITLKTRPSGAQVKLEGSGTLLGVTPLRQVKVPAGPLKLVLTREGFQSTTVQANVPKDQQIDLPIVALKAATGTTDNQTAKQTPTTKPVQAKEASKGKPTAMGKLTIIMKDETWGNVKIDGVEQSEWPHAKTIELTPGTHTVSASPNNKGWGTQKVIVEAGKTSVVSF